VFLCAIILVGFYPLNEKKYKELMANAHKK